MSSFNICFNFSACTIRSINSAFSSKSLSIIQERDRLLEEKAELLAELQKVYSECCPDIMDITKPVAPSLVTWERLRGLLHKICPPEKDAEYDGMDWDSAGKQYQDDIRESEAPTPYDP